MLTIAQQSKNDEGERGRTQLTIFVRSKANGGL